MQPENRMLLEEERFFERFFDESRELKRLPKGDRKKFKGLIGEMDKKGFGPIEIAMTLGSLKPREIRCVWEYAIRRAIFMNDKATLNEIAAHLRLFAGWRGATISWENVMDEKIFRLYGIRLAGWPSRIVCVKENTFPTERDAAEYLTWLLEGFGIKAEDFLPSKNGGGR